MSKGGANICIASEEMRRVTQWLDWTVVGLRRRVEREDQLQGLATEMEVFLFYRFLTERRKASPR